MLLEILQNVCCQKLRWHLQLLRSWGERKRFNKSLEEKLFFHFHTITAESYHRKITKCWRYFQPTISFTSKNFFAKKVCLTHSFRGYFSLLVIIIVVLKIRRRQKYHWKRRKSKLKLFSRKFLFVRSFSHDALKTSKMCRKLENFYVLANYLKSLSSFHISRLHLGEKNYWTSLTRLMVN